MNITAATRSSLIRTAGQHAKGSPERRAVLALLLQARTTRLQPEQKDNARMEDMIAKSGGNEIKLTQYATAMAKAISEWMKAERRGSAADQLGYEAVAKIFWDRADQLKGPSGAGATVEKSLLNDRTPGSGRTTKAYAIPMGAVNLKTGDNRVFNFIKTWGNESQCLTIAENVQDQRRIVIVGFGGPGSGYGRGTTINLISDQTRGELGVFAVLKDVIGPMTLDLLKEVAHASGKWSLPAYVLK